MDESNDTSNRGLVERAAERLARREFLRRGGKIAVGAALAGWFLGPAARARAFSDDPLHPEGSPHCEAIGFGCDCISNNCYQNGAPCTRRYNECPDPSHPNGGYCWGQSYGGRFISCCDFWCYGNGTRYRCHCCKFQ